MSHDFMDSGMGTESTSSTRGSSAYDFVKGFITGQIALLSLLFFIVRFLFFRSVIPVTHSSNSIRLDSSAFTSKTRRKKINSPIISPCDNDSVLLERLFGLDHQVLKQQATKLGATEIFISDESATWLNFMLSKMIFDPIRTQTQQKTSLITNLLQNKFKEIQNLKSCSIPALKYLENIQIKSIELGIFYPIIDSYQLIYDPESECCALRIKCSWKDAISLEIESAFSLLGLIALPFSISAKLKNLKFTAQLQTSKDGEFLEITCLPDDYLLIDLEVGSLIGHRTKLKDLPKIKNAIIEAIKKILSDTIINPKGLKIPLPKLNDNFIWPNEKNEKKIDDYELNSSIDDNESDISITNEFENFISKDINISMSLNDNDIPSIISDESGSINIFLDSRYDDFENEMEMQEADTLLLNTVVITK